MKHIESSYKSGHRTNAITSVIGVLGILLVVLAILVTAKGANTISDGIVFSGIGMILVLGYWFLVPRSYQVLTDQLIINYGIPRAKVVMFEDITKIDIHKHKLGAEIRISKRYGSEIYIHPLSIEQFQEVLQRNISQFRSSTTN